MKKILLLMMCCPAMLAAQNGNGVTLSNLMVNAGTVTFNVSWRNTGMPTLWSDSVWVFVDYNKAGRMERLPVTNATATAGTIEKISGNDQGVWVIGNARSAGSFSATVQLLTEIKDIVGACAYASNYPPVAAYTADYNLKFTGTPPYNLVIVSEGSGTRTCSINDNYFKLYDGEILQSFTDKTGTPGMPLPGKPIVTPNSRCGEGEITLHASPISPRAVIDWYDAASGGAVLNGGHATDTFTPSITSSTTYYAQARDTVTHYVSASRVPVLATVNDVPTLILSSGTDAARNTVDWLRPITDIIYTAEGATIALSSGSASLPPGLSGTVTGQTSSGTTYTISGTPAVAGVFRFTLSAPHAYEQCTGQLSDSITVSTDWAPYARTKATVTSDNWMWSDLIELDLASCDRVPSDYGSLCANCYTVRDNVYYYGVTCAEAVLAEACRSPWSAPTYAALFGSAGIGDAAFELWGPTGLYYYGYKATGYAAYWLPDWFYNNNSNCWQVCWIFAPSWEGQCGCLDSYMTPLVCVKPL